MSRPDDALSGDDALAELDALDARESGGAPRTGEPARRGGAPAPRPRGEAAPRVRSSPISTGMWIALIVSALLLVLLLVFVLQNNVPANIHFLGWSFTLPLGAAILFAAIAGVLLAGAIGSARMFLVGRRRKRAAQAQAGAAARPGR